MGALPLVFKIVVAAIIIGQTFGTAYFATVVKHDLRPYFLSEAMDADAKRAQLIFIYLVLSTVTTAIVSLKSLMSICICCQRPKEKKQDSCFGLLFTLLLAFAGSVMLALAVVSAQSAWIWSQSLQTNGQPALAGKTRDLAKLIIVILSVDGGSLTLCAIGALLVAYLTKRAIQPRDANETADQFGLRLQGQEHMLQDLEAQLAMAGERTSQEPAKAVISENHGAGKSVTTH